MALQTSGPKVCDESWTTGKYCSGKGSGALLSMLRLQYGCPGFTPSISKLLYATSFLVSTPSRYEVVDYMATHAVESGKIFALNLSSAEMIKVSQIRHRILSLLPKTVCPMQIQIFLTGILFALLQSLLFSNEIEARTLAQSFRQGIGESDISAIEAATEIAMRLRPGGTAVLAIPFLCSLIPIFCVLKGNHARQK